VSLDVASVDAIARRVVELLRARPTEPVLLSAEELARAFQVSRETIRKISREGCPVVRVESLVRYDVEEVKSWLRSRDVRHEPSGEPPARRVSPRR